MNKIQETLHIKNRKKREKIFIFGFLAIIMGLLVLLFYQYSAFGSEKKEHSESVALTPKLGYINFGGLGLKNCADRGYSVSRNNPFLAKFPYEQLEAFLKGEKEARNVKKALVQIGWGAEGTPSFDHLVELVTFLLKRKESVHVNVWDENQELKTNRVNGLYPMRPALSREQLAWLRSLENVSVHLVSSVSEPTYPKKANHVINVWHDSLDAFYLVDEIALAGVGQSFPLFWLSGGDAQGSLLKNVHCYASAPGSMRRQLTITGYDAFVLSVVTLYQHIARSNSARFWDYEARRIASGGRYFFDFWGIFYRFRFDLKYDKFIIFLSDRTGLSQDFVDDLVFGGGLVAAGILGLRLGRWPIKRKIKLSWKKWVDKREAIRKAAEKAVPNKS